MKLRSNAHCHTTFCDGKNTPEEMILAALDRDFVSLGFSMHGWTPFEPTPVNMKKEVEYREALRWLREKYRGQIEILIGVEREYIYERDFTGFEYIIDSAHCLLRDGECLYIDWSEARMNENVAHHFGGDYYAYCRAYFQ